MSTIIFILLVLGLFILGLNLLPVAGLLSPNVASGLTFIVGQMKAWNFIFPISEMLILVGVIAGLELGILAFKFFRWGVHYLRGFTQ